MNKLSAIQDNMHRSRFLSENVGGSRGARTGGFFSSSSSSSCSSSFAPSAQKHSFTSRDRLEGK